MYVCVCHAVTDRDIARAVSEGADSIRDLRARTGLGSTCGRCAQCANACLKEARASEARAITMFHPSSVLSAA